MKNKTSRYAPQKFKSEEWDRYKDHIDGFFLSLDEKEKEKLLHNSEFRIFLLENIRVGHQCELMISYFTRKDIDNLFDKDFLLMKESANIDIMKTVYLQLDTVDVEYLIDKNIRWIDFKNIYLKINKMHDEYKFKIMDLTLNDDLIDPIDVDRIFENFFTVGYNTEYILDYSANTEQVKWLECKLEDEEMASLFLHNKGLNLSLDPENRCRLYENVNFDELDNKYDRDILLSLLHHAVERSVKLPNNILRNEKFINLILKQDWNEYKRLVANIKEINPRVAIEIESRFNAEQDEYINEFMGSDYEDLMSSENYDIFDWKFRDRVYHRFFNTSASDVYLTACAILDSMNTLPGYKEKFSPEGVELIERMVVNIVLESSQKEFDDKMASNIDKHNMNDLKDIIAILQTCNDWREMFEKAIKIARQEFSKNLVREIYRPNIEYADILEDLPVIDISEMKDFRLLIHDQRLYDLKNAIPKLDPKQKKDISMSLLDNNHLHTYQSDGTGVIDNYSVTFGYGEVAVESIIHALPEDSFTEYCNQSDLIKKESLISATCQYLPTYIDIHSFLNETNKMNEIKVRAKVNGLNNRGENAFMPSYILCRDVIRDIDKRVAREYGVPIVYIDTKRVEKSTYSAYIPIITQLVDRYTKVMLEDNSLIK
ncbi:MAG: hypothetical protein ACLRFL_00645 [Clostridia bacterium]